MEEEFEVESRPEAAEESSGNRFITAIAITTAALAVCAALSSQLAGRAAHHSLADLNQAAIAQNLASDQWTFYQAEGLKRHVFQVERDVLRLQSGPAALRQAAAYDKEIARYTALQKEIMKDAKVQERQRDEAKAAAQRFDERYRRLSLGGASFQIAIVVSSVAAIVKRRSLWYLGLAGGAVGLFFLAQELVPVAGGKGG
jgi:hypothetical protein